MFISLKKISFALIVVAGMLFSWSPVSFADHTQCPVNGLMTGTAEATNLGTIYMSTEAWNTLAPYSDTSVDFGVYYDSVAEEFWGRAWSQNVGWLEFSSDVSSGGQSTSYGTQAVFTTPNADPQNWGDWDGILDIDDRFTFDGVAHTFSGAAIDAHLTDGDLTNDYIVGSGIVTLECDAEPSASVGITVNGQDDYTFASCDAANTLSLAWSGTDLVDCTTGTGYWSPVGNVGTSGLQLIPDGAGIDTAGEIVFSIGCSTIDNSDPNAVADTAVVSCTDTSPSGPSVNAYLDEDPDVDQVDYALCSPSNTPEIYWDTEEIQSGTCQILTGGANDLSTYIGAISDEDVTDPGQATNAADTAGTTLSSTIRCLDASNNPYTDTVRTTCGGTPPPGEMNLYVNGQTADNYDDCSVPNQIPLLTWNSNGLLAGSCVTGDGEQWNSPSTPRTTNNMSPGESASMAITESNPQATYSLTCDLDIDGNGIADGGTVTTSANVSCESPAEPPTVDLLVELADSYQYASCSDPTNIPSLSWTSTNADYCEATAGQWNPAPISSLTVPSGSQDAAAVINSGNMVQTYRIDCEGPGGITHDTATVSCAGSASVDLMLNGSASPASPMFQTCSAANTATISWTTQNVQPGSCTTGTGPWLSAGSRGDSSIGEPTGSITNSPEPFSMSCLDLDGNLVYGNVEATCGEPTAIDLWIGNASNTGNEFVTLGSCGDTTDLFWTTTGLSNCSLVGDLVPGGTQSVDVDNLSGYISDIVTATPTNHGATLECQGPLGTVQSPTVRATCSPTIGDTYLWIDGSTNKNYTTCCTGGSGGGGVDIKTMTADIVAHMKNAGINPTALTQTQAEDYIEYTWVPETSPSPAPDKYEQADLATNAINFWLISYGQQIDAYATSIGDNLSAMSTAQLEDYLNNWISAQGYSSLRQNELDFVVAGLQDGTYGCLGLGGSGGGSGLDLETTTAAIVTDMKTDGFDFENASQARLELYVSNWFGTHSGNPTAAEITALATNAGNWTLIFYGEQIDAYATSKGDNISAMSTSQLEEYINQWVSDQGYSALNASDLAFVVAGLRDGTYGWITSVGGSSGGGGVCNPVLTWNDTRYDPARAGVCTPGNGLWNDPTGTRSSQNLIGEDASGDISELNTDVDFSIRCSLEGRANASCGIPEEPLTPDVNVYLDDTSTPEVPASSLIFTSCTAGTRIPEISWTSNDIVPGSCEADSGTGNWTGAKADTESGTTLGYDINIGNTTEWVTVTCESAVDGSDVEGQASVSCAYDTPTIDVLLNNQASLSFSDCDSNAVVNQVNWTAQNVQPDSCVAVFGDGGGVWSGTNLTGTDGDENINVLLNGYTEFGVQCDDLSGATMDPVVASATCGGVSGYVCDPLIEDCSVIPNYQEV